MSDGLLGVKDEVDTEAIIVTPPRPGSWRFKYGSPFDIRSSRRGWEKLQGMGDAWTRRVGRKEKAEYLLL